MVWTLTKTFLMFHLQIIFLLQILNIYSVEQLNKFNNRNKNNSMIMKIDIRSIYCSSDKYRMFFRNQQDHTSVLLSTETWFTSDNVFDLGGYQAHHIYRANRSSRGSSVDVKNDWIYELMEGLSFCDTTIETVGLKVSMNMHDFFILAI